MVSRINCRVPLTIVDDHSKCPRKESRNQEIQRFETTDHLDSFLLKAVGGDEEMVSSGVNLTLLDFHQENVGESDRPEGGVESESMTPEEGRGFGFGEIRRLDGGDRIKIHHYRMRTKGAFQEGEAEEIRRLLSSVFEVLRGGENKKTRRRREWLMKRKSVKETSQSRIQRGGGSGWEGEGKIDSSSDRKKEESKEAEGGSDHDGQGHRYFLLGQSPQTVGTCVALLRLKNWSV
ncbi:hypothetical protein IE53DRAFT_278554 [Violaceomyces palustris]|uniref:Uncharacterized protein n=1 Tax=Violaceomyces palustris TaxID=1673888 RepID=A0ACD0NME3_9BASI|nr:hypothetical protein IE53DRAFT_278554 [Violaceomyces palustris]